MSVVGYLPPSQFTLRADVRLVEVAVVVRDRSGRTVAGLPRDSFEIKDNGKNRKITAFSEVTSIPRPSGQEAQAAAPADEKSSPRFVALVIDDFNSGSREFQSAQMAARAFVKDGLASGDRVGLFSTYGTEIAPYTNDAKRLIAAIDGMRSRRQADITGKCPTLSAYESYLIADDRDYEVLNAKVAETSSCYPYWSRDRIVSYVTQMARANWAVTSARSQNTLAAIQGIVDTMGSLEGRRMLLLVSGGFLSETLARQKDNLVAHALRAGVTVNSLDAKGVYTFDVDIPPGGDITSPALQRRILSEGSIAQNLALAELAQSTGGRFFLGNNDISGGFRELAAPPEVTYLLAFSPDTEPDGAHHKLEVRLKGVKGYSVQARPGYYASKDEPSAPVAERRIDRELFVERLQAEVPVTVTTAVNKGEGGLAALVVTVRVDVARLTFLPQSGRRAEKLAFLVAVLDEQGNFVEGKEGAMEFSLRQETYAWLVSKGLSADFQLTPRPGKYRLRAIVESANQGKLTAIDQTVEIP